MRSMVHDSEPTKVTAMPSPPPHLLKGIPDLSDHSVEADNEPEVTPLANLLGEFAQGSLFKGLSSDFAMFTSQLAGLHDSSP